MTVQSQQTRRARHAHPQPDAVAAPPVSGALLAGSSGAGRSQPRPAQSLAPGWRVVTVRAHQELALLLSTLALVMAVSMIIVLVVAVRDGVRSELWNPRFLTVMAGSIAWLSALGFFIGALRVSSRTTQALSAAVFFLMFFGSGAAMPLEQLPEALKRILEWNPLKQWLDVAVGLYTGTGVERVEWLRLLLALPLLACCVLAGARMWRRRS